jgi:outer membrane protein TolC
VLRRMAVLILLSSFTLFAAPLAAQQSVTATAVAGNAGPGAPLTLTLQDALSLARVNDPTYRAARTDTALAHQDKVQARAALLPNAAYNSQYLYTEGNGTPTGVFIANNAVHEYTAQANAHENINLAGGLIADYRRSAAAEAVAAAKQEIAARGLVVTVVQTFYGLVVAQRAYANAQQASAEAQHFLSVTQQLERGGEVAHADVIKAQIQYNIGRQSLREAQLAMEKARLTLAVLIFPNFNENFTVVDDLQLAPPLPSLAEAEQMAAKNNPELRAALAGVQMSQHEVQSAWAAHFPTLGLDVWYGIDAAHFATYDPSRIRNLGYSAAATLNVPIFNWGATQSKVKQAELRRTQSEVVLSEAQRGAIADLRAFYSEADTARTELDSLRQSADLAAESLRLAVLRYQAGEATALEVVDAQNTLVQSRNAFDQGEARYRTAIATLQTVTGTF